MRKRSHGLTEAAVKAMRPQALGRLESAGAGTAGSVPRPSLRGSGPVRPRPLASGLLAVRGQFLTS